LEGNRHQADKAIEREGVGERQSLLKEREQEDADVQQERQLTDEKALDELEERQRALAKILRLEREQTDERLLIERARADAAVTARDDFMGMVSHDVRTLLGGLALSAELQIKAAASDEAGQQAVRSAEKVQRYTARINRLLGDLLDVASIEAGRFTVEPKPHEAAGVIRDSLEAFQPSAAAKHISLAVSPAESPLRGSFDYERIIQVLANLLSNAIKFTEQGGAVSVGVERSDGELCFSVSDTGKGIPSEQLSNVFERFWQASRGDRRGLGLGLFISRRIVEAHGGRIWAESQLCQGSTFRFTLPIAPEDGELAASRLH
jgi:signal transduction histidine kinase